MWEDSRYFWVVLCRNHWFHARKNLLFRHRIPLAETDAFAARVPIDGLLKVRCDECKKEYVYKPSEVMRVELEPPESFTPHPLFRDEGADSPSAVAHRSPEDRGHRLVSLAQNIISHTAAGSRSLFDMVHFSRHRR